MTAGSRAAQLMTPGAKRPIAGIALMATLLLPQGALAIKSIDYQRRLNPKFVKRVRPETRFIIVHSTESRLPSALRTLSRGKVRRGRYVTRGGHAHYLIARSGAIYRILDPKYWANHAGVSMWNGTAGLSDYSVGVELEGYHNVPFPDAQYSSLTRLLDELQEKYGIEDRDVLEHYRVAYAAPNRYHRSNHRGRKLDPGVENFERARAGLDDEYPTDPDVIAGRIDGSPELMRAGGHTEVPVESEEEDSAEQLAEEESLQISRTRTAWKIAGIRYNARTTMYRFPDGRFLSGEQIVNWSDIPPGTRVELGAAPAETKVVSAARLEVAVPQVTASASPWKIANALYNSSLTFYILPDGTVQPGNTLRKKVTLPVGTKVLVAYHELPKSKASNALGEDLDDVYLDASTLYVFPDRLLRSGDQIENFLDLPASVRVFAKVD
jgi:hypothetical protein